MRVVFFILLLLNYINERYKMEIKEFIKYDIIEISINSKELENIKRDLDCAKLEVGSISKESEKILKWK